MRALAVATITLIATPALAEGVLPFDGAFGNEAGCHLYATGEGVGDGYLLLTPDTFASYGTACDFEALVSSDKPVFTLKAVCQAEGKTRTGPDHLQVIDHGVEGYGVKFDGLDEFGPLKTCPPIDLDGSSEVQL